MKTLRNTVTIWHNCLRNHFVFMVSLQPYPRFCNYIHVPFLPSILIFHSHTAMQLTYRRLLYIISHCWWILHLSFIHDMNCNSWYVQNSRLREAILQPIPGDPSIRHRRRKGERSRRLEVLVPGEVSFSFRAPSANQICRNKHRT